MNGCYTKVNITSIMLENLLLIFVCLDLILVGPQDKQSLQHYHWLAEGY